MLDDRECLFWSALGPSRIIVELNRMTLVLNNARHFPATEYLEGIYEVATHENSWTSEASLLVVATVESIHTIPSQLLAS